MLQRLADADLVKGRTVGIDATPVAHIGVRKWAVQSAVPGPLSR
jgi:hypothetical protein